MYSETAHCQHGWDWFHVLSAENICYYHNYHKRPFSLGTQFAAAKSGYDECFYTLTFSLSFPFSGDTAYLAYSYPLTYSQLRSSLDALERHQPAAVHFVRQPLCFTRGGNVCELITITDFSVKSSEISARPVVVLSARVHPGETVASWVMHGAIAFLTGNSEEAIALRQRVVLKIVPMLNPDGVIDGNHRCSLSGADLNRHYRNPSSVRHPTIYHFKKALVSRFYEIIHRDR